MKITAEQAQKIIERYEEAEKDDDEYHGFGQSADAITDVLKILGIQYKFQLMLFSSKLHLDILDVEDAE